MPTECNPDQFDFARVEGRRVVAGFDGGAVTSDAGALLLGATERAINLVGRLADCFLDARKPELVEHQVATLVGQRVFAIALGYEDLNDHDELRHDPMMAILAGKLRARREDCAPVAGKSTLNRLELSKPRPGRYHKISHDGGAIESLFVDLFLEAHGGRAPKQIVLDLDATDDPVHGHRLHGLCLDVRPAPHRPEAHPLRRGDLRDPAAQAPEDRRPRRRLGAKDQAGHDLRPSLARRMGPGPRPIIRRPLSRPLPPSPSRQQHRTPLIRPAAKPGGQRRVHRSDPPSGSFRQTLRPPLSMGGVRYPG